MGSKSNENVQQPTAKQSTVVEAAVSRVESNVTSVPYHEEFSIFKDPTNVIQAPQQMPKIMTTPQQPESQEVKEQNTPTQLEPVAVAPADVRNGCDRRQSVCNRHADTSYNNKTKFSVLS